MTFLSAILMNGFLFFVFILALHRLEIHLDAKRNSHKSRKHTPKFH
jgi:hypothetical protein